ncbi:interleukin-21 [Ambystoma mexicanum]|uniref:interleukin-21 n=1 Tax=Ambystoma mexicanum TaxID=8296 RepID=UPI0037E89CD4
MTLLRYKELGQCAKQLKSEINDTNPEWLYTPDAVEDDCLHSALECFQNQSSKLKQAKGSSFPFFERTINLLKVRKNDKAPVTPKSCKACQAYRKDSPRKFLESMVSLVQQLISKVRGIPST